MPSVTVKKDREESLRRFHPWLFSGAIARVEGEPRAGDLVTVQSGGGEILGYGHYSDSSIAVKMLTFTDEYPGEEFLRNRIRSAANLRRTLGLLDNVETTAFRLVHAEGDGLPGLIVDVIGSAVVAEIHSGGMYRMRDLISEVIAAELGSRVEDVVIRVDENLAKSGFEVPVAPTPSGAGLRPFKENGHLFSADLEGGQKTGFFTDQRENRRIVAAFAKDKNVLDCFCYSGGFAAYAAKAGARAVTYVDASKSALELAKGNIERNAPGVPAEGVNADALHYLKGIPETYDLIVLDPPAFVKHRGALTGGCKGYESINYLGISRVRPGGIVATFSCSQLVTTDLFRKILFKAAQKSGRRVRVLAELRQAPCHPVSLYHPEGEYLKGLLLEVE